MANRYNFDFEYPVSKLISVVKKQAKHHRERERHYREEYAKAEKDLREKGITMVENAAVVASGNITGYGMFGKSATPVLNQEMVEKVNAAKTKIQEHMNAAIEYEKWSKAFTVVLSIDETKMITLSADDVDFFKLEV